MPLGNILIEGVILVLAAVGIYEGARLSKVVLLFTDPLGPGWYLFFTAALLFVCTGVIAVKQFKRNTPPRKDRTPFHRAPAGRAMLLLLLYGLAASFLGYLAASFLFFLFVQRVFGERSWVRCVVIGTAITGVFYFGFSYLAGVPLP